MTAHKIVSALTIASLAACGGGGGGSSALPQKAAPSVAKGSAIFTLKVPAKSAQLLPHKRNSLVRDYESPATLGVGIGLALAPASAPSVQSPTVAIDLTSCSAANGCVANGDGSHTYTLTGPLVPAGTYNVNIATWDVAPTAGTFPTGTTHELSDAAVSSEITTVNTDINATLNGIPNAVEAVPIPGQLHAVQEPDNGFEIIGNAPTQWSISALDNAGYIIAGDGAPVMTFTDATGSLVAAPVAAQSNLYTITAARAQPTSVTLSISAKGVGPSGVIAGTPGSVAILPVQELWETVSNAGATGQGFFGFQLNPNPPLNVNLGVYMPASPNYTTFISTDGVNATGSQNFQAIAQDSTGSLWVYDSAHNQIDQYLIGTSGTQQPTATGVAISTTGQTIAAMAGDSNGFLYVLDHAANAINVYAVTSATPSQKYHVPLVGPAGNDLTVIPNAASLPSGVAGSLVIASDQGVVFYTNASTGTPTEIGTPIPGEYNTDITRAAVSPDDGALWTNEPFSLTPEIVYYSISGSPPSTTMTFQTGRNLANNDSGPLAPGIKDYVFSAGGTDLFGLSQYFLQASSILPNSHCSCLIGNGTASPYYLGAFVAP